MLACLNAIGQLIYMPVYPVWSIVVLTLYVLVINAIAAHWNKLDTQVGRVSAARNGSSPTWGEHVLQLPGGLSPWFTGYL